MRMVWRAVDSFIHPAFAQLEEFNHRDPLQSSFVPLSPPTTKNYGKNAAAYIMNQTPLNRPRKTPKPPLHKKTNKEKGAKTLALGPGVYWRAVKSPRPAEWASNKPFKKKKKKLKPLPITYVVFSPFWQHQVVNHILKERQDACVMCAWLKSERIHQK